MTIAPQSSPLDPALLAAFRQQGGAIVAQERGLTPACRIKLAGLARSLGIAEDQIDVAIRALRETEPEAPPNPEAEKFRKRLRKDLSGKTRTIIGPTIEAQILEAAKRKYSLDEAAARQVIGEVAAELGLTRITSSDAIRGLGDQIDQVVGDSTWLAREGWDRLRSAGAKWGIELEVVDELIDEQLAANREEIRQKRFWTQATLIGAGSTAALVAVAIVVLMVVRGERGGTPTSGEPVATTPLESPGEAEPTVRQATQPGWWDVDLAVEMAAVKSKYSGLSGASDLMASNSPDERAAGYEKLINQVRAASPPKLDFLSAVERIVVAAHALEPNEAAAARLRSSLLALLPTPDSPLPARADQYEIAYWAAETAAASLHHAAASDQRKATLASALGMALAASFDPTANTKLHQDLARARTTWLAYQQLAAAASTQPAAVAALYRPLTGRAARFLSDDELLRVETTLLTAALPAAGPHWKAYEEAIVRCASSTDSLNVLKLTDTLAKCNEPELIAALSQLLILRTGARPETSAKADVVRSIRKSLGATGPLAASSAAERWQTLREQAAAALAQPQPSEDDHFESLRQTVELAHLTTLAMALAQGEAGFASFDAGLAEPPVLRRTTVDNANDAASGGRSLPSPRRASRVLSSREEKDLERFSTMLAGHARQTPPQRLNALRALSALGEAADILPAQADSIARYLHAEKSDEEHAAVVSLVGAIRGWKRLRLAVADHWDQSKLTPGQTPSLAHALIGRELPAEFATPENVRGFLIESVLRDLAEATSRPTRATESGQVFESAADELTEIYRERAKLLSVGPAEYQAASSPAQALELSLTPIAATLRGSSEDGGYLAALPHMHKAAKFLADDDLRQTVANQRLLVELSSRRVILMRKQHAAAARQLDAESLAAVGSADRVLVQLRQQEATLLQLWMLYAPEA